MKENIKQKIEHLTKNLIKYSSLYYGKSKHQISDYEYDLLLKELEQLENEYPEYKLLNSPTTHVGFYPQEYLKKYQHKYPMLSIKNALNKNELFEWFNRLQKDLHLNDEQFNDLDFFIEPKIDGVSISLDYEKGKLVNASTRGNGKIGEEVLNNIKQISKIPWKINLEANFTIRGEIFSLLDDFAKVNIENHNKFSNPRNFASGTVRLLDPLEVKKRNLSAFFYQIISSDLDIKNQTDIFKFFDKYDFPHFSKVKSVKGIENIIDQLNFYEQEKGNLPFEIDGVVLKLNNHSLWEKLGNTSKFPKSMIAFKFSPEIVVTKLIDIFPTVGRTGLIVYNAKLTPIKILGSIVSFATLHNLEYIKMLDLRIGDYVEVKKSGEIIPKVIRPILEKREKDIEIWKELEYCPVCNTKLVFSKTRNDQFCMNENCESRIINKLIHFSSKEALDFNGFGEKNIKLFFDSNLLKNISDFYTLKDKKNELLKLEGFKERSINKILSAVEDSKKQSLERILFGFGIHNIGSKTSQDISKHFQIIDRIISASLEEIENIPDFGPIKALSLFSFFKDEKNLDLIKFLKEQGVNFEYIQNNLIQNTESRFYKKVIVITGTFENNSRKQMELIFYELGAIVRKNVSSKTDFLIVGENPSDNKINSISSEKIIRIEDLLNIM